MIIDAKDLIMGRLATFAAKKALLGETIDIVNCEFAIVSGDKQQVFSLYKQKKERGTFKGPFFYRGPDRFVRRAIRGMLPYKQPKGSDAYKRIMCYNGIPEAFLGKEMISVKPAHVSKLPTKKYISVGEICRKLGGKI
ncbi:MAG: 50S ribosomal protein L13 [Nanoarchaeota archaeon]